MTLQRLTFRQVLGWAGLTFLALLVVAAVVWRGDILESGLDPEIPFQTYQPPPAPDYHQASAWALSEARKRDAGWAAVFFVHPTTYDGGREWNGPIDDGRSNAYLTRVILPNYAGPFARAGSVSAPHYRQASLYTRLTLREDAREARAFAYRDIEAAFEVWLGNNAIGPIVVVGVEQGADLAERLLQNRVAVDPSLRRRFVAAYLIENPIPASRFDRLPLCSEPSEFGCVMAWTAIAEGDYSRARRLKRRAMTWSASGSLVGVDDATIACVNPVTGRVGTPEAEARKSRGSTNASGLEWGARPAMQSRLVRSACRDGFLWRSDPGSESFGRQGSWADQHKVQPFNLFYADIEADVLTRLSAWRAINGL